MNLKLTALAATVCAHDPRTRAQRRADALGALAADANRLALSLRAVACRRAPGVRASPGGDPRHRRHATLTVDDVPGSAVNADGLITPELIAELAHTATLAPLIHPGDTPPEPNYTPSKALVDFVRCRDLTCAGPAVSTPPTTATSTIRSPTARAGPPMPPTSSATAAGARTSR